MSSPFRRSGKRSWRSRLRTPGSDRPSRAPDTWRTCRGRRRGSPRSPCRCTSTRWRTGDRSRRNRCSARGRPVGGATVEPKEKGIQRRAEERKQPGYLLVCGTHMWIACGKYHALESELTAFTAGGIWQYTPSSALVGSATDKRENKVVTSPPRYVCRSEMC